MNAFGLSQGPAAAGKQQLRRAQPAQEAKPILTAENVKFAAARFAPFAAVIATAMLFGHPTPTLRMMTEKLLNPFK